MLLRKGKTTLYGVGLRELQIYSKKIQLIKFCIMFLETVIFWTSYYTDKLSIFVIFFFSYLDFLQFFKSSWTREIHLILTPDLPLPCPNPVTCNSKAETCSLHWELDWEIVSLGRGWGSSSNTNSCISISSATTNPGIAIPTLQDSNIGCGSSSVPLWVTVGGTWVNHCKKAGDCGHCVPGPDPVSSQSVAQ